MCVCICVLNNFWIGIWEGNGSCYYSLQNSCMLDKCWEKRNSPWQGLHGKCPLAQLDGWNLTSSCSCQVYWKLARRPAACAPNVAKAFFMLADSWSPPAFSGFGSNAAEWYQNVFDLRMRHLVSNCPHSPPLPQQRFLLDRHISFLEKAPW